MKLLGYKMRSVNYAGFHVYWNGMFEVIQNKSLLW